MMAGVELNVSRETHARLEAFAALVQKWTRKINLISKSTVPDLWERHILDSVQIYDLAPKKGHWLDIGSGGGFPGIVVAILARETPGNLKFTLIESDQRKCAFLRTAIRELDLDAAVLAQRIELAPPQEADVLSARALADLGDLLEFAELHLKKTGVALFPKGEKWKKEDEQARQSWSYSSEAIPSRTNPEAAVLRIKEITRV